MGIELVPGTRRLALMNCLLHGMEGDAEGVVHLGNALGQTGAGLEKADVILANPPFGTSQGGDASITRDDLTYKPATNNWPSCNTSTATSNPVAAWWYSG